MFSKKMNLIIVPHGAVKRIAQATGYSAETVKYALRGVRDTEATQIIRKLAIKEYGGLTRK